MIKNAKYEMSKTRFSGFLQLVRYSPITEEMVSLPKAWDPFLENKHSLSGATC